ncbi:pentapeptide repeat-containing protein [Lysobacter sp. CA196]|uniref:pentapeptide repeat-containing protein n=1 Tax=Lysobacter sp. CA196 TaxID=3455606 RepID=UPI003F8D4CC0
MNGCKVAPDSNPLDARQCFTSIFDARDVGFPPSAAAPIPGNEFLGATDMIFDPRVAAFAFILAALMAIVPASAASNLICLPKVKQERPRMLDTSPPKYCPDCNFAGVDWSGQDLTDVNLQGADLSGTNLSGANLSGAELSGADLSNANLRNAVLNPGARGNADLSSANLSGAIFTGAQMNDTDLQYTDLSGTNFSATDLSRARLGPAPRTGLYAGRKTSFRRARLMAGLELDAASSDASGAEIVAPMASIAAGRFDVSCGSSDLSTLSSAIYVAANGQDSSRCGSTASTPCATITKGLSRCAPDGCGVLVSYGQYAPPSPLVLRNGVALYGGCVPAGKSSAGLKSLIQAPPGGMPAAMAIYIDAATRIEGFKLHGSPASQPGAASIAFQVSYGGTSIILADSEIYAGSGAVGANGCATCVCNPDEVGNGRCGSKGVASKNTAGLFKGSAWSGLPGGDGDTVMAGKYLIFDAGGGGRQGGGSFGIVLTEALLQASKVRVVGGSGGNGGNGGAAVGAYDLGAGTGAGGNGGPAIGIALIGGSPSIDSGVSILSGLGGKGGVSGKNSASQCSVATGDSGNTGLVADQQSF